MTTVNIHPPTTRDRPSPSPLPTLLQTPSGLAILELQGTINLPQDVEGRTLSRVEVGRIDFPDHDPSAPEGGTGWMKRVHLYIGQHQRLTGEVKKLPKAFAVVRRCGSVEGQQQQQPEEGRVAEGGDLEVVEIVKYKLLFAYRPEPVGTAHAPA